MQKLKWPLVCGLFVLGILLYLNITAIAKTLPALNRTPVKQSPTLNKQQPAANKIQSKEIVGQSPLAKANPQIKSVFTVPVGALRPLSKLYVKGKYFGKQTGKILLYRYSSPIELINVNWVDEKNVNGVVPDVTKTWQNQTVKIQIKTADNRISNSQRIKFVSREKAWLEQDDVIVVTCGNQGNSNFCNRVESGAYCNSQSCDSFGVNTYELAIVSRHSNTWGASEDDSGVDRYSIHLKNGWVFKGIQYFKTASKWTDVSLEGPWPRFPVGKSDWTLEYKWMVTPNDTVCYGLKISVEGPVGTYYK